MIGLIIIIIGGFMAQEPTKANGRSRRVCWLERCLKDATLL